MTGKRYIATGCLLTCVVLSSVTAFCVYRLVSAVSSLTIQAPNFDFGEFSTLAITEFVNNGEPKQKLELLSSLQAGGQSAAAFGPLVEPLLNDPNAEIRAAAVTMFTLIDPSALMRATGPPPPAMPRATKRQ